MKKFCIYFGILLTFLFAFTLQNNVYAGTHANWELALEHDSGGSVIQGSIVGLKTAIENGADVRVTHIAGCGSGTLLQSNSPERVNIDYSTNTVYGVTSFHALWAPDSSDIYQQKYSTNGEIVQRIHYNDTGSVIETTISCAIKWFVNK